MRPDQAHAAVAKAVRKGRLHRQPCEVCGAEFAEAHHDDYERPLDVRWLCHRHHMQFHRPPGSPAILVRAKLTQDEWLRLRTLAMQRNQASQEMIGEVLREFVDTHNPNREEKASG